MTDYLDLERRFGLLTKYSVEELLAVDIMGHRHLDWEQLLTGRFSIITARANFGKTMELRACARRLRDEGKHAVFVALHGLLEEPDFQIALETTEAKAFGAWEAAATERLHLFVDSLDEAALGRELGLQSALRRVSRAVGRAGADVSWIISSRPATLTPSVLEVIQAELCTTLYVGDAKDESPDDTLEEVNATDARNAGLSVFDAGSTVKAMAVPKEHLKVFRLLPLSSKAARLYLEIRHGVADGRALLDAARRFGLNDLADGPGSLDVLSYVDPLSKPPRDLTSIFERMVAGVQAQQRSDHRESLVGRPSPESLDAAVAKLAAASAVCQLPNMELAADALKVRDGVLSCRPLVGSLLSESSLTYLLGSRLFIDSGQHQVKLYPEQLLPYLAAKHLSSLVQSPEDARRLIVALSWRAVTGECGVHRAYLSVAGWMATFNVHCRLELLDVEPQAVAFFGDLRSTQVPLADASTALKRSLVRLSTLGDTLGRNQFTLTAENYWQAAKPGIEATLLEAYDSVGSDWHARTALLDIATHARLDVFRDKVLSEHGNDYVKLLGNSAQLVYLMALGRDDDAQALADAAKASPCLEERTLRLLLGELAWKQFDAKSIAELASKQFMRNRGGFNLRLALKYSVADSASPEQLAALTEGLLSYGVNYLEDLEGKRIKYTERNKNFAEAIQELIALVVRAKNLPVEHATQLCLTYYQAYGRFHFGRYDQSELTKALKQSDAVRQNLLREAIAQTDRTSAGIRRELAPYGLWLWEDRDVEALAEPGFTELATTLRENAAAAKPAARTQKPKRDELKLDEDSKVTLLTQVDSVKDGSNTNALAWIARWLSQTNHNSRYGECDFSAFETAAGPVLASAARAGLSAIWRKRAPEFNEREPLTTYYVTVAGIQGLHLDLGDGAKLPALSDAEVKQALFYGRFELNGYPKWFWSVVRAHEAVALEEFRKVLAAADAGAVSADKADVLIRHLRDAPIAVQYGLGSAVWMFATSSASVNSYALEAALNCAVGGGSVDQNNFEGEAWSRISAAFRVPLPTLATLTSPENADLKARSEFDTRISEMMRLRSNAVVWGLFWLLHYPSAFGTRWERWRTSEQRAAEEFMFDLAAYIGEDRHSRLRAVAEKGMGGLKTLAALYEWVVAVVHESEDIAHEDGPYHVGARDNAQRLRDSLLPMISSVKSQAAYEALDELRRKATGANAKYIQRLQFQMREEEAYVAPVAQQDYAKFERDFSPPVTSYMQFAQAVHNDLLTVKRDIEHGEFSLRRFFNLVVMEHIKTDTEGLALEEDFQALLGSALNYASSGRYGVTLEPILPAATRRDVLCQVGDMRATVELKMSERWTVADYVVALAEQLKGQYMQASNSKIGFFVVVLQRHRKWDNPTGGELDFAGLIRLLEAKALELQAADPALFLRIVGVDAAPQADFRKSMAATKAAINGPAKYADENGNTWTGKGRRPKWLKDALATGKTLADFDVGQPIT